MYCNGRHLLGDTSLSQRSLAARIHRICEWTQGSRPIAVVPWARFRDTLPVVLLYVLYIVVVVVGHCRKHVEHCLAHNDGPVYYCVSCWRIFYEYSFLVTACRRKKVFAPERAWWGSMATRTIFEIRTESIKLSRKASIRLQVRAVCGSLLACVRASYI